MNSDRPNIIERLEDRAQRGNTTAKLNLYRRQISKLIDQGFSVEKIAPVYGRIGQHHCRISWRNAQSESIAYRLLMIAAGNNDDLCKELMAPSVKPVDPPYNYD